VWQHRKLRRQAEACEGLRDMRLVGARAFEAGAEAVGLSQLETNVIGGVEQLRGARLPAPEVADALIVLGEFSGRGGDPA